jgi:hypothetical protein
MPPKRRRHSPGPGALGDIPKEVHMITAQKYTETYNLWKAQLQDGADKIVRSSEARKYLIKNSDSAPLEDLLIVAVKCIADLTGDTVFQKEVIRNIERRK